MEMNDVTEYIKASKDVIDILKSLGSLLPKGRDADAAQSRLEQAERALQASEAQLAKALGFKLCKCTFPPQIMLWKEEIKANVCSSCGHNDSPPAAPQGYGYGWSGARRGR